jgi:glutathione S-transferase
MITGINHINLSVSHIERSFNFYVDLLGLKPLCKWPNGAYLLAGNDWFCLNLGMNDIIKTHNDYTHYAFSINSSDFQLTRARLLDAGVMEFKENRSEGNSFYFLDPDLHKLEIHVGDYQTRLKEKIKNPWPGAIFYV